MLPIKTNIKLKNGFKNNRIFLYNLNKDFNNVLYSSNTKKNICLTIN